MTPDSPEFLEALADARDVPIMVAPAVLREDLGHPDLASDDRRHLADRLTALPEPRRAKRPPDDDAGGVHIRSTGATEDDAPWGVDQGRAIGSGGALQPPETGECRQVVH